jgi:hypothetical protein
MKADLREIYGAPTRAAAEAAIDVFADKDTRSSLVCLSENAQAARYCHGVSNTTKRHQNYRQNCIM